MAIDDLGRLGVTATSSSRVLMIWHREFRDGGGLFKKLNHKTQDQPTLFTIFPEAKTGVNAFCMEHIANLTMETVHSHITTDLLGKLEELAGSSEGGVSEEGSLLLQKLRAHKPGLTTVWEWMRKLGWKYDNQRKVFMLMGMKGQHRRCTGRR